MLNLRANQALKFTHNQVLCDFTPSEDQGEIVASITLDYITPKHFVEAVKLLKETEHKIFLTVDSLEIRFQCNYFESKSETDERFEKLMHLKALLEEVINSPIPIDLAEFKKTYFKTGKNCYFRRRQKAV